MIRAMLILALVAALAAGLAAAAPGGGPRAAPNQEVQDLLSGIDFVPPKSSLDGALVDPRADLNEIATDGDLDSGLRIRAVRALALYPGGETPATLQGLIAGLAPSTSGTNVVMLRAAMYALVAVDPIGAYDTMVAMLDHPSRDVRTDAAHGLAQIGQISAVPVLRAKQTDEPTAQVRWALIEAIRSLDPM